MIPTLSQVCSLSSDFATDVTEYAAGEVTSLEIWLTKLEQFLERHTTDDVLALLREHHMAVPVASFQGGLFQPPNPGFEESWNRFQARLDLCRQLAVETLVVAGDIHESLSQGLIERVTERLQKIAVAAESAGVRVAFEFQASATFGNNLETAVALVTATSSAWLGLCLDCFHYHVGPSKPADLGRLTAENLFHVQLCDLAGTAQLATDGDRILPGEGDIGVQEILDRLTQIVYRKAVSIEVLNPQLWQIPPRQFGEIGITALRKILQNNVS